MKKCIAAVLVWMVTSGYGATVCKHEDPQPSGIEVRILPSQDGPVGSVYHDEFVISNKTSSPVSASLSCHLLACCDNGLVEIPITNETWSVGLPAERSTNIVFSVGPMVYGAYAARTALFKAVVQLDNHELDFPWLSIRTRSFSYPDISFRVQRAEVTAAASDYVVGVTVISNGFPYALSGLIGKISVYGVPRGADPLIESLLPQCVVPANGVVSLTNDLLALPSGSYKATLSVKSDRWPEVRKKADFDVE